MGKFTQGPWKAHKANWHTWLVLQGGFQVAIVEMSEGTPEDEVAGEEARVMADANLIAAAPELYEALEKLTQRAISVGWDGKSEWLELAEALDALKKARG